MTKDEEIASLRKTLDYWQKKANAMKPTSAQIEAAGKAMEYLLGDLASAALNAAAQVEETFDDGYKYKEAECKDEIERLRSELEIQRDSQISAVNQMLAVEVLNAELVAALEKAVELLDDRMSYTSPSLISIRALLAKVKEKK